MWAPSVCAGPLTTSLRGLWVSCLLPPGNGGPYKRAATLVASRQLLACGGLTTSQCVHDGWRCRRPEAVVWAPSVCAGPLTTSLRGLWVSGLLPPGNGGTNEGAATQKPTKRRRGRLGPRAGNPKRKRPNCYRKEELSNQRGWHHCAKREGAQGPQWSKGQEPWRRGSTGFCRLSRQLLVYGQLRLLSFPIVSPPRQILVNSCPTTPWPTSGVSHDRSDVLVGSTDSACSGHPFPSVFVAKSLRNQISQNFRIFALSRGLPQKKSELRGHQMAMRDDFGQKIRAETPSNGCADPVRKKSELSVCQMAITAIVAPSLQSW